MTNPQLVTQGEALVRPAVVTEAAVIAEILRQAFGPYRQFYSPDAFRAVTPTATEIAARFAEGPIWIAEYGGSAVGTVSATSEEAGIYLRSLAVVPEMQGRKIGSRLLNAAEEFARASGHERIFLYTTYFVPGARSLYENHGFRWVRDTPPEEWFNTPGLEMEKILTGKN